MNSITFCWLPFLLLAALFGQDVQYSHSMQTALYLNPAFSGSYLELSGVGANFRNTMASLNKSFVAYSAYLEDHFFRKAYNSWLSAFWSAVAKESFTAKSDFWNLGLVYSYRLRLGEGKVFWMRVSARVFARDALFVMWSWDCIRY